MRPEAVFPAWQRHEGAPGRLTKAMLTQSKRLRISSFTSSNGLVVGWKPAEIGFSSLGWGIFLVFS